MFKHKLTKYGINALTVAALTLPSIVAAQELSLGLEYASSTGLGSTDLRDIVNNFIRVLLGFLGLIAVIIILVGGFQWMTAGGDDAKVEILRIIVKVHGLDIVVLAVTRCAIEVYIVGLGVVGGRVRDPIREGSHAPVG